MHNGVCLNQTFHRIEMVLTPSLEVSRCNICTFVLGTQVRFLTPVCDTLVGILVDLGSRGSVA